MKGTRFLLLALSLAWSWSSGPCAAQSSELEVLARWGQWADAPNLLRRHFSSLAFEQLAERREKIESLRTTADWKARQAEVRQTLLNLVGPFPVRTPLNARVSEIVEKGDYRIEKVVFESRPGFHVTGCLFIPIGLSAPGPVILNVIGHNDISFHAAVYQQLLLNLVAKGFIVFAIDPVGQGERLQYYDPELGRSRVGQPTREHSYFGKQCFLANSSAAHYFTWDGIRAIDYLVSRSEVDPDRIGVTGLSGGGTQTAYISALDERVLAAAPACYICGFQRLLESIGPQDAEQNVNRGLAHGIDHGDFLEIRAPKPTLVVATTRDFFSIQGARETVAEARKAFEVLNGRDNLTFVEDDFGHGYTPKNRQAIYAFFQKHLSLPGDPIDRPMEMLGPEDLTVTETGQVLDSLGGETVYSLNRSEARRLSERVNRSRERLEEHLARVGEQSRQISGYLAPQSLSGLVFRGRLKRPGYSIEQYVMSGEGSCIVPFLFFLPEGGEDFPALIYLHPQGKSAQAQPGGEIEWWVSQGYAVLAPDLSGSGELGSVDNSITFLGVQIGRSVVGIRASDIVRCVRFLQSRKEVRKGDLTGLAHRGLTTTLVHAAVFEPSISRIVLIEPLISMRSVVENRFYSALFSDLVPNALGVYDLPDLKACLAPRRLLIVNPVDQLLNRARRLAATEYRFLRRAFAEQQATENLQIRFRESFQPLESVLSEWLGDDR